MNSAYAKYARAQKHLAELRASVDLYRKSDLDDEISHRVSYPYGDSDRRAVVTMRFDPRAPSEWSVIMGDILTNLRAALDHAVYGHGINRQQLNSDQRKRLYHPMSASAAEWDSIPESTADDGTIKPARQGLRENLQAVVNPDVLAVIEKNQPFNAEDGQPFWHGLAILSGLVNRDKHRAVLDISINAAELELGTSSVEIISEGDSQTLPDGSIEKEFVIRRAVRRPDGAVRHTLGLIGTNAAFLEEIEIPNTGERRAFINVIEMLVEATGNYLNELKEAGC